MKQQTKKAAHATLSTLVRTDADGSKWFRVIMSDGRVITMCVPAREDR